MRARDLPWLVGPSIGIYALAATTFSNLGLTDALMLMAFALLITLTVALRSIAYAVEDLRPPRIETRAVGPDDDELRRLAFGDEPPNPGIPTRHKGPRPDPAPRRRTPATEERFDQSVRQLREGGPR